MRTLVLGLCVMAVTAVIAQEAAKPADEGVFEVATLKRNKSGERGNGIRRLPGGRVTVTNMPVRFLITAAYGLGQWQLIGGPSWLADDHFDITAKLEGNPVWGGPGGDTPDPLWLAFRELLADKFKLKIHTEKRDLDAFALVMVKPGTPGSALKPSDSDCKALAEQLRMGKAPAEPPKPVDGIMPCSTLGRIGQMTFDGFEMKNVANMFVGQAGRPVVDRTGLVGKWKFLLTYYQERPQNLPPEPNVPPIDPNAPSFFTAIQEQLGLKLESTKAPFEVTIIDSVEHPKDD